MRKKLTFSSPATSSEIHTLKDAPISEIFELPVFQQGGKYAIITDTNIARIYKIGLSHLPENFTVHTIRPGEGSKKLSTIEKLTTQLLKDNMTKSDTLVALGGGVVGDITGLLASLYMRGIPYIQIPTTLLAMCDSGIGGKTGVNTSEGKNLLGTIQQPVATIIQARFLQTLPPYELRNGMIECLKCAIVRSKKLFNVIRKHYRQALQKDPHVLNTIIEQTVRIKCEVVEQDPEEKGIRKMLNYGHTIGHAIEKISKYTLSHGAAVSIGIHYENLIALNKKIIQKESVITIQSLLEAMGFSTSLKTSSRAIMKSIRHDKKRQQETIHMYLPSTIGVSGPHNIPLCDIENILI